MSVWVLKLGESACKQISRDPYSFGVVHEDWKSIGRLRRQWQHVTKPGCKSNKNFICISKKLQWRALGKSKLSPHSCSKTKTFLKIWNDLARQKSHWLQTFDESGPGICLLECVAGYNFWTRVMISFSVWAFLPVLGSELGCKPEEFVSKKMTKKTSTMGNARILRQSSKRPSIALAKQVCSNRVEFRMERGEGNDDKIFCEVICNMSKLLPSLCRWNGAKNAQHRVACKNFLEPSWKFEPVNHQLNKKFHNGCLTHKRFKKF